MNHYLITIQYDGSANRGWQRLANEPDTVQGILENALSAYFKESIRITGSGAPMPVSTHCTSTRIFSAVLL